MPGKVIEQGQSSLRSGLVPCAIANELAAGKVVRVMPSIKIVPLAISHICPSRIKLNQRTRVLIDFLLQNHKIVTRDR